MDKVREALLELVDDVEGFYGHESIGWTSLANAKAALATPPAKVLVEEVVLPGGVLGNALREHGILITNNTDKPVSVRVTEELGEEG